MSTVCPYHTHSLDNATAAAEAASTMIFNAPRKPFEQNIRETRQAVEILESIRAMLLSKEKRVASGPLPKSPKACPQRPRGRPRVGTPLNWSLRRKSISWRPRLAICTGCCRRWCAARLTRAVYRTNTADQAGEAVARSFTLIPNCVWHGGAGSRGLKTHVRYVTPRKILCGA